MCWSTGIIAGSFFRGLGGGGGGNAASGHSDSVPPTSLLILIDPADMKLTHLIEAPTDPFLFRSIRRSEAEL